MAATSETDLTDAVLHPVRGHHAFESSVGQLGTAIRLGVYPNGSSLPPERELAERMAVSRATLREAITALRTAGLVRTTRGRGGGTVVVHHPTPPARGAPLDLGARRDALLDSLVFRRVVEPGACYLAASRTLTDVQEKLLADALEEVSEATDPGLHRQADSRLHLAIATTTDSRRTIEAVTSVQADLHDMLTAIPVLEVNIEHSADQHRAVVGAILDGDATRARRVMERHCDDTAALLRGLLG
ncbi:MAG: FadR/GntR family transcriptional regulator [Nocardioidaceae bacterium]